MPIKVENVTATAAAKSFQLCPTLCDPIDGSPSGSAIPGIPQAKTLEWVDNVTIYTHLDSFDYLYARLSPLSDSIKAEFWILLLQNTAYFRWYKNTSLYYEVFITHLFNIFFQNSKIHL